MFRSIFPVACTLVFASASFAGLGPFTETFDTSAANWVNSPATSFLDHFTDGGPNGAGDGYASSTFNFFATDAGSFVTTHRAQDEFGSSGGAFEGNYVLSGITSITFDVRHDMPSDASVFVRLAGPANFPGGVAVGFTPIPAGEWTTVTFVLTADSPQIVSLEGQTFEDVFSNIGHIQFGVDTPESTAGVDVDYHFDIDNVSIAPTPGTIGLFGMGSLVALRRTRRS